jgi:hypothetical protein
MEPEGSLPCSPPVVPILLSSVVYDAHMCLSWWVMFFLAVCLVPDLEQQFPHLMMTTLCMYVRIRGGLLQPLHLDPQWSIVLNPYDR